MSTIDHMTATSTATPPVGPESGDESGLPHIQTRVASDGYPLSVRYSKPDGSPIGWVVMLHGIQSHSGWYAASQYRMRHSGFCVHVPDRRGSGLNQIDRGHARHWQRLVNDVVHILNDARHERETYAPRAPVILCGLSWGGKLAYAISRLRPDLIDGLVLLYPGIKAHVKPTRWQRWRLQLARQFTTGRRLVPVPLNEPLLFTSAQNWQEFIRRDPLALHAVSSGFLVASQQLEKLCEARYLVPAGRLNCSPQDSRVPTLLMLAGQDKIVDNAAVVGLLKRHLNDQLHVVTYPEAAHTLEFEPCSSQFLNDLVAWLSVQRRRALH